MAEFKKGDVVALKSGGPPMTVVSVTGGEIFCRWFLEGKMEGYGFEPEALRPLLQRD